MSHTAADRALLPEHNEHLGKRLRETRLARGLTPRQAGDLFDANGRTVSFWEQLLEPIPARMVPLIVRWIDTGEAPTAEELAAAASFGTAATARKIKPLSPAEFRAQHDDQAYAYAAAVLSQNTRYGYSRDWKEFTAWCKEFDREHLPCSDETLALCASWSIESGYRLSTTLRHVQGVVHYCVKAGHPNPRGKATLALLKGAKLTLREKPQGKHALPLEDLHKICALLCQRGSARSLRDRAILVLGFACGFRKSNLVALNLEDFSFEPEGLIVIERRSKTDQRGVGRRIGLPPSANPEGCPVRAVQDWIAVRGSWPGPLFVSLNGYFEKPVQPSQSGSAGIKGGRQRLRRDGIVSVVKRNVKAIGADPAIYSSHSLRAGCVTAAAEAGASIPEIMRRTGHKSGEMVERYIRHVKVFANLDLFRSKL